MSAEVLLDAAGRYEAADAKLRRLEAAEPDSDDAEAWRKWNNDHHDAAADLLYQRSRMDRARRGIMDRLTRPASNPLTLF